MSHKKKRKRLREEARSVFYSTDGMRLWKWVMDGLHRVVPSPVEIVRMCVLVLAAISIGLICLLRSPALWLVVGGFTIASLTIKTLWELYLDMKRERERARAMVRRERARARKTIKAIKEQSEKMEQMQALILRLMQQRVIESNAQKYLILQLAQNNNIIYLNGMNFFGNVDMNGGNIYGDNATHKETHYHFGNEQKIEVNNKQEGMNNLKPDPVLHLLDVLVKTAIVQHPKSPKHILLPVRAARDAEVLPMADLAWVNARYGLTLSHTNWSDWVSKEDSKYDPRELNPLLSRFRALKIPEK
ncbi:MAG: hypothetical protein J6T00_01690 [Bacteroidaceae bacterium]|nr:hypothetical protein [Bacteroidaceae bacterium]